MKELGEGKTTSAKVRKSPPDWLQIVVAFLKRLFHFFNVLAVDIMNVLQNVLA
jgi:hypothetical protein